MKKRDVLILALLGTAAAAFPRPDHPLERQLVTVQVTYQEWNEYRPWQKMKPSTRRIQGIVISGNRIMVLSQHLEDATLVQVEKFDRPPRVPARIIHRDPQVDLALITVDAPAFFDDLKPMEIAETADGKNFYSAKWNSGQLSTSSCRWSRVTVQRSYAPYFSYAAIRFISDLKSGGWGEPVCSGTRLSGVVQFQSGDQITMIPAELIRAYLAAVERPEYPGFAALGLNWQYNRGHAQAEYYGLKGTPRGVRVCSTISGGSTDGVLKTDDILLELDGHSIDSQGDYLHPRYGRLDFSLIAGDGHYAGDTIPALILRDGKEQAVDIPLKRLSGETVLIPSYREKEPPYLVAGGFVFRELDTPYLGAWGKGWKDKIPTRLRIYLGLENEENIPGRRRMIVLADVFPDQYNLGYHDMAQNIVKAVNSRPVDSIADMEEAFKHPAGKFHVIELVPSFGMSRVILDASTFESATESIMNKYRIPQRIRLRAEPLPE